jgi:glyoxylase-like metal-dependent hydrolase (beta-lactamase superfamily II)
VTGPPFEEVYRGVYLVRDTCNVYVIVADNDGGGGPRPRTAITIDFGSGLVLDLLEALDVDRITDVLMTHHHRDQGQGLPRAVEHGARVHVPPVEIDLFERVEEMWSTRQLDNDYNVRQDRFSLLEPVPVDAVVPEYRHADYGGVKVWVMPTPGHTTGSVSYLLDRDGGRIGFSGDLIYGPGKVWSLAASQWSYTSHEGPAMVVLSCYLLQDEQLDVLLPSHGRPMRDPHAALELLAERMQYHVDSRRWFPWDLRDRLRNPYVPITRHVLMNRSSLSTGYVLLSDSGEALFIDYGYDMMTGLPTGTDRAARRPWLASLPALQEQFGVTRVSAVLPTHYHDDHVAGMPLLRDVHGTEIWSPTNVAPVLADPWLHDLPCQWYEPIPSDRELPLGESFTWHEYTITVHEQPGHTLFAAAFEVEVDGVTIMFTGDQQEGLGIQGDRHEILNYQYRNRFRIEDYRKSAALYKRVAPGLLLSGHWEPRWVDDGYLEYLAHAGEDLIEMHQELLPLEELDLGSDGVMARIAPYRSRIEVGGTLRATVSIRNPHRTPAEATVRPVVPYDWPVPPSRTLELGPGEERDITVDVVAGPSPVRRARFAVDLTVGSLRLGQHAEAIIDVVEPTARQSR